MFYLQVQYTVSGHLNSGVLHFNAIQNSKSDSYLTFYEAPNGQFWVKLDVNSAVCLFLYVFTVQFNTTANYVSEKLNRYLSASVNQKQTFISL